MSGVDWNRVARDNRTLPDGTPEPSLAPPTHLEQAERDANRLRVELARVVAETPGDYELGIALAFGIWCIEHHIKRTTPPVS